MITVVVGPISRRQLRFSPEELVQLADGSRKPASAIAVGDLLFALGRVMDRA